MKFLKLVHISLLAFLPFFASAQESEPEFYKYGFPQDEIYIDINKATKESKKVTKLKLVNIDLSLNYNKLGRFRGLKVLKLQNNKIDSLPNKLFRNYGMKYFFSSGNKLKNLSSAVSNFGGLEVLKLQKTELDSFPSSMSSLRFLSTLEIQSNIADTFKLNGVIPGLISLENLLFYNVRLYNFPNDFSKNKKLKEAYFINCRISRIDTGSSSIYSCEKLELLILENNMIKDISIDILQLKNLKMLSFKNNKIKVLPEYLSRLKNLEKLDLRGNPIPRHQVAVLRILMPKCRIDY